MNNFDFTLITVVKNDYKNIEKTLKSISNLKYRNFQYIVIDGNSSDETKKIINKYRRDIDIFLSEPDNGIYDAMNKGIRLSQGEIIAFCNSGDTLFSNSLELIKKKFDKDIDFVFGTVVRNYTGDTIIKYGFNQNRIFYNFDFATAHSTGFFLKKKVYDELGLYDTKFDCSSDYDFYLRLILKKKYKGSSTEKNELVGEVASGGYSSTLTLLQHLNEETRIRLKNKQNIIIIIIIYINTILKNFKKVLNDKRFRKYKLKRKIFKFFLNNLPRTQLFDKILSFVQFTYIHKRLPKKNYLFNDRLYYIKTSNEIIDPLRVFVTDKEFSKIYLSSRINKEHIVPTLGVYNKIESLYKISFPLDYIVKPSHLAGHWIMKNKDELINKDDLNQINKWTKINQYYASRERNYLFLKPKIIIEPIIFQDNNINDYKIFCFKGNAKAIQVDSNRRYNHVRSIYDRNWNNLNISIDFPINKNEIPKPKNLDLMIELSERISKDFDFIRVDLYTNDKHVYVGEITNNHGGALETFIPEGIKTEKFFSDILFNDKNMK